MRLYSFVNYYLSPLQHGLQTAHCVGEMMAHQHYSLAEEWAANHKTIIICNGGNAAMLAELYAALEKHADNLCLPLVKFNEDEVSLNCALTSVALVVPEYIYASVFVPDITNSGKSYYEYINSEDERINCSMLEESSAYEIARLIKSYRLA